MACVPLIILFMIKGDQSPDCGDSVPGELARRRRVLNSHAMLASHMHCIAFFFYLMLLHVTVKKHNLYEVILKC